MKPRACASSSDGIGASPKLRRPRQFGANMLMPSINKSQFPFPFFNSCEVIILNIQAAQYSAATGEAALIPGVWTQVSSAGRVGCRVPPRAPSRRASPGSSSWRWPGAPSGASSGMGRSPAATSSPSSPSSVPPTWAASWSSSSGCHHSWVGHCSLCAWFVCLLPLALPRLHCDTCNPSAAMLWFGIAWQTAEPMTPAIQA